MEVDSGEVESGEVGSGGVDSGEWYMLESDWECGRDVGLLVWTWCGRGVVVV